MFEIFKYDNYKSKSVNNHVTYDTKYLQKYIGGGYTISVLCRFLIYISLRTLSFKVKAIKSNSNPRVTVQNGNTRVLPKAKDAPLSKSISSGQTTAALDGIDISICANVSFLFIHKSPSGDKTLLLLGYTYLYVGKVLSSLMDQCLRRQYYENYRVNTEKRNNP